MVDFYVIVKDQLNMECNKSAQSNLGRGPRRDTVARVRRKVPIGYNGAPQICPQKYPLPWTDPQTPLPASSSDLWCQTASGSDPPFLHNALDRPTHRPTDRPRESLITIGRCAPRATRPNNYDIVHYGRNSTAAAACCCCSWWWWWRCWWKTARRDVITQSRHFTAWLHLALNYTTTQTDRNEQRYIRQRRKGFNELILL